MARVQVDGLMKNIADVRKRLEAGDDVATKVLPLYYRMVYDPAMQLANETSNPTQDERTRLENLTDARQALMAEIMRRGAIAPPPPPGLTRSGGRRKTRRAKRTRRNRKSRRVAKK